MKHIQIVLNAILSKNVFEYLLIDREMKIVHLSLGTMQFLNPVPSEGNDIRDYLPELVGSEEEISKVFEKTGRSLNLKTIQKENYYFNIYVDHYDDEKALILLQNITEITQAQQKALQYSNQTLLLYDTLQKIIDGQNTLIFVTDNQERIVFANQKFLDYFDIPTQDELKNENVKLYEKISNDLHSYEDLYHDVQLTGKHLTIDEDTFMIEATLIDAVHHLFTLTKMTDFYRKKKNLEVEVERDSLTGLLRKKYFDLKLQQLFLEEKPLALVVVDIDNFKIINDTYGHPAGDKVLKMFAALLQENLRDNDMIARWGGEEFLFTLNNIEDIDTAMQRVEAIRKNIEAYHFEIVEHLTASFGVTWREEGDTMDSMLYRADKALYEAKNSGKNRVVLKKREKLEK